MGLSRRPAILTAALALAIAVTLAGCGSGGRGAPAARHTDGSVLTTLERGAAQARRGAYWARVRAAVLRGEVRDFATGTRVGGPAFQVCLRAGLREALDPPTLTRLAAVYRGGRSGPAFAAQALNALAAPLAGRCGHRAWVPKLIAAAHGLRVARLGGAAVRRLGITYGPYLGVRCRLAAHPGCGLVGIDVVLRRAASRVVALLGGHRLVLRTPGEHNRVRRHDWVGTLTGADFFRPGSPFYIPGSRNWTRKRARHVWAGYPPVYVPVELRVRFADGRHAGARIARVFVSPGWG